MELNGFFLKNMKLENSELENKYGVVWQFIAENKKESSEWNSL